MKNFSIKKIKVGVIFLIIFSIICCTFAFGSHNKTTREFLENIHFLNQRCGSSQGVFSFYNVNNADASVIYTNNEIGLIDTGLKETAAVLTQALSQLKANTLDFIVISHPHNDHAGGYLELLKTIQVKCLFIGMYTTNQFNDLSLYNEIIRVSNELGVEIVYVTYGMTVQIGSIFLQFFDASSCFDDENHNSILVKAIIGNKSCLYTGDVGRQAEMFLLSLGCDLSADILKVGHHGSNTASCEEFLNAVQPKYSVISVGYNDYGHPHEQTVLRLSQIETTIYRTDICQKILFQVFDDIINVKVE